MKNKLIFSSFLIASMLLNAFVFASENILKPKLAISPPRLEIKPAEKATESITVLNLGNTPMQVVVGTQNWDLDENNKFRALAPTEQSLDQWLVINPVKLEIPANSQQTVRMAVRPRVKPEAGEHRAMVFFKQLPDPDVQGARVSFKVGVPVYAYYGEVVRTVDIHSIGFNHQTGQFEFDLSNTGNSYVRPTGSYVAVKASDYTDDESLLDRLNNATGQIKSDDILMSGVLVSEPVLANERRVLTGKTEWAKASQTSDTIYVALKVNLGQHVIEKVFRVSP